jgi:hypothetical protein
MLWPGWNDLDSIKTVSSRIADIIVGFWVTMALLEVAAFFGNFSKRAAKWLAGLGLLALVVAVFGEVVQRKYEHRKDALYDEREAQTVQTFDKKVREANAKAAEATGKAQAAQDATKIAADKAIDTQTAAHHAQADYGWGEEGIGSDSKAEGYGFTFELFYSRNKNRASEYLNKLAQVLNRLQNEYPDSRYAIPTAYLIGQAYWSLAGGKLDENSRVYWNKVLTLTADNGASDYRQIVEWRLRANR